MPIGWMRYRCRRRVPARCRTSNPRIHVLARHFVDQVVEVLRGASLRDLVSHEVGASGPVANGRPARGAASAAPMAPSPTPAPRGARSTGRLPRRSADEIQAALDKIVALLKKHKDGLRAGGDPLEPRHAREGDASHLEGRALDEEAHEQGTEASDDVLREVESCAGRLAATRPPRTRTPVTTS